MSDPWSDPGLLPLALERICLSAPVEVVLEVLDDDALAAFEAALRASASRPEAELHQGLLDRLRDENRLSTRRGDIAAFFGDRGDASIVPVLWDVFTDASTADRAEDNPPVLAITAAIALAKLRNFDAGNYLVDLLSDGYPPTRALAAKALWIAVGPGMTRALSAAALDSGAEVRLPAVQALFLLRNMAAVDALVAAAASDDPEVVNNAVVRANDITGAEFSTSWTAEHVARQWNDHRPRLRDNVRYRLGQPLSVADLFALLRTNPDRHDEVIEEIRLTTGVEPVDEDYSQEVATEISNRLSEVGVLYRWGHKVNQR
jgi:HEAT repeat protein